MQLGDFTVPFDPPSVKYLLFPWLRHHHPSLSHFLFLSGINSPLAIMILMHYHVVLVPAVQQSESAVRTHMSPLP